jgi:hypothetical protein
MAKANLSSMSVEALIKLRDKIRKVLNQEQSSCKASFRGWAAKLATAAEEAP